MLRIFIALALVSTPAASFAKGGPHYGGGRHTYSHGGHYVGGLGSNHRGNLVGRSNRSAATAFLWLKKFA